MASSKKDNGDCNTAGYDADDYLFPYTAAADDDYDDGSASWLSYLQNNGYVVLQNVLSNDEVDVAKDLVWKDLEGAHNVSRHNPSEWQKKKNWTIPYHGIDASLSQTAGPWYIRGNTNIQQAFAQIWNTNKLITSMDAVILWRSDQQHGTEGLHLDQNPFTKPKLDCIQGMVPLLPVSPEIGGLQVVPLSHTKEVQENFCTKNPEYVNAGDFLPVDNHNEDYGTVRFLKCQPGDLILWDSRTMHGGIVGPSGCCRAGDDDGNDGGNDGNCNSSQTIVPRLTRMSITVAMTPRSWASPDVLAARVHGFQQGISFNHCPHEGGTSSGTFREKRLLGYQNFELTGAQRAVL